MVLTNDNEESRKMVEQCYKRNKTALNPIIEWSDSNVWEFIKSEHIPYCSLYDEGFARLGCIGCPQGGTRCRERDFQRWPKYKDAYLRAFDKMLRERERKGKIDGSWKMGTRAIDVFNWWMEYDVLPGQIEWQEYMEEIEDE